MFFDPHNLGVETLRVKLSTILSKIKKKINFSLIVALISIFVCKKSDHPKNGFIIFDRQIMGLDTCAVICDIDRYIILLLNIHFSVMAELICTKMVR